MRKTNLLPTIGMVVLSLGFVGLGMSNPALSDYQERVLKPVAAERHSASDAMLTSILQSISLPGAPGAPTRPSTDRVTLLTDRTKRANYVVFSVYSTEFDYCETNRTSRAIGRSLAIAGKFYTIDKGECTASS